jgi:hypothetical protein
MFAGYRATAELSYTCPPEMCCNCGKRGKTLYVDTPLQRTRFFLFFGTEYTLTQTLPYCAACKRSARRIRLSLGSKVLCWAAWCSAVFLAFVLGASSLPKGMDNYLFFSSLGVSFVLTFGYFWLRSRAAAPWYYQPAELVDLAVSNGSIDQVTIGFFNHKYAQIFANANAEAIQAGMLRVGEMPGQR